MVTEFLTAFFEAIRSQNLSQIVHSGVLASKHCLFIPYFYTQNEILLAVCLAVHTCFDFNTMNKLLKMQDLAVV